MDQTPELASLLLWFGQVPYQADLGNLSNGGITLKALKLTQPLVFAIAVKFWFLLTYEE